MATASPTLDCPVCEDTFQKPKLLACNHTVCRKCIVDWLKAGGHSGGCPLCRARILSSSPSPDDDLEALVDALPTDLVLVTKVESQQLVNSSDVCMSCDNNLAAVSFCLQCRMKLCTSCTKSHKKFPAMKNHVVEDLSQLTPERLAAVSHVTCQSHDDRLAELFCSSHGLLICPLCSSTTHRQCPVQLIQQAAVQKREELKRQVQSLRDREKHFRAKIKKTEDMFADMRARAKSTFDDLQQRVERKRQRFSAMIQAAEDKMALKQQNEVQAAITSQAGVLENLLQSATDDVLLDMVLSQESRLQQLQQQMTSIDSIQDPADVSVDGHQLTQLKAALDALGQKSPPPPPPAPTSSIPKRRSDIWSKIAGKKSPPPPPPAPTSSTPRQTMATFFTEMHQPWGGALARVLKVGDRVFKNPDYDYLSVEGNRGVRGTVTAIPSRLRSSLGADSMGWVDVKWDDGGEFCYRMGKDGEYHLDRVSMSDLLP